MSDIIRMLNESLVNNTSINRVRNNLLQDTNNEDIEKARQQINYQLICSALEKAIIETFANYPDSESTTFLKEQVSQSLAELQIIMRG